MTVMGHQSFFETEKSPQTRMNTKKKGLTSFLSTLHGGGEGSRTPVRKSVPMAFYECSASFVLRQPSDDEQTADCRNPNQSLQESRYPLIKFTTKLTLIPDRGHRISADSKINYAAQSPLKSLMFMTLLESFLAFIFRCDF